MKQDMSSTAPRKQQHPPAIHPLTLRTGVWKELFSEKQCAICIAEGLNRTVDMPGFANAIAGYLINSRSVQLVLYMHHRKLHDFLAAFYQWMREGIRNALDEESKGKLRVLLEHKDHRHHDLFEHLFESRVLRNEPLVRLITGRDVKLPYYDPSLQRLKDEVNASAFCSAIDYSGAEGPVVVKLITKKDWKKIEEAHHHDHNTTF